MSLTSRRTAMAPRVVMPALSRSERSCMSPSVAPGRRCAGRAGQSTKSGSMRFDLETSHLPTMIYSPKNFASKRSKAHRLFEPLENDLTVSSGDESPFIAAYLAQINPSLRILSLAASGSANSVPDDQLGGGSYDCTLRDCDCYVAGVPAGSCGKSRCRRGPTFRSWQAFRVQLF